MSDANEYPKYSELKKLTEPELRSWIGKGCRQAFDILIPKHAQWIKDRLHYLMQYPEGEKEVYQRFLIRMWKTLLKGGYEEVDFRNWMGTIIKNMVIEYRRRPKKFIEFNEETEEIYVPGKPDSNIQKYEWANDIQKLKYGLREDYYAIFEMRAFGQLSIKEIAEIVHESESKVKSAVHRSREHFQKQLGEFYLNTRIKKHTPVKLTDTQKESLKKYRSPNDDNNDLHTWRLHGEKWVPG